MSKCLKKVLIFSTVMLVIIADFTGRTHTFLSSRSQIVYADSRYVVMSKVLSKQQVRDWAKSIRQGERVGKASASAVGYLVNLAFPGAGKIFSLAGFVKPAYLSKVKQAADQGKRIKMVVTDSKTNHTSYSVSYQLTIVN